MIQIKLHVALHLACICTIALLKMEGYVETPLVNVNIYFRYFYSCFRMNKTKVLGTLF